VARRRTKKRRSRTKRTPQRWTKAHVRRVFWRAGFGATAADASRFAKAGRKATLDWLMRGDGPAKLEGPSPSADGKPLDRVNEFGHDALWWLDRMVRSTRPLEEKLTLFFHDHFATRDQTVNLMLRQNETLRAHALGRFDEMLRAMTLDPALQQFLSLAGSHKHAPNENFARELMELFTLGGGYTEDDVREASRALTGYVAVRENGQTTGVRFDASRHDGGTKTIFGKTGAWKPEDVLRLCLEHPRHAPFMVEKLWAFLVGRPILPSTRTKLAKVYVDSGLRVATLVRRILDHPHLYKDLDRPWMVKWPAVYVAGQLRAMGAPVDRKAWVYLMGSMGQRLFAPPSVAGWEWGPLWMSSNSMRPRFIAAGELTKKGAPAEVREGTVDPGLGPNAHLDAAKGALGVPLVSPQTDAALRRMAAAFAAAPEAASKNEATRRRNAEACQRALRQLLVACPENQVC
jgi:uncharacterized protein (DUF1800 family)